MSIFRGSIALIVAVAACHGTEATYSVSGSVSGASVPFTVKLNGTNDISMSGDGSFKFTGKLVKGNTFNVQIVDTADNCTVAGGAGTIDMSDINDVGVSCVARTAQSAQTVIRTANLNGAQENPSVATNALGVGGVVLAPASLTISGGMTFSGLAPVAVEIRQAPLGNPTGNGSVLMPLVLASDGLTAIVPPTVLTLSQFSALLAGELYFNVTTAANPAGEIRGPIQLQGGVATSIATLDASQVVPLPSGSTARGTGTLMVDQASGKIIIAHITHNVANVAGADIHTSAAPLTNGVSIVLFPNFRTNIDGAGTNLANPASTAKMSAQHLADFANGLLYFEIDSQANPNGDIRGNISQQ